jgi:hypothetical protein
MTEAGSEDPILIELLDDTPSGRSSLGEVFRRWAGDADIRVLFTPDVLIAVSTQSFRGYLFDDGWTVECWIERGVRQFRESLETAFGGAGAGYAIGDSSDHRDCPGLLELAINKGDAIADVRHLI